MFSKILLGHDGTLSVDAAVPEVAALARDGPGAVILVHAVAPLPAPSASQSTDAVWTTPAPSRSLETTDQVAWERARALRQVKETQAQLRSLGVISTTTFIVEARPEQAIARIAEREGCDLIVIGMPVQAAATRVRHGSTTERILTQAAVPVLLVGARH